MRDHGECSMGLMMRVAPRTWQTRLKNLLQKRLKEAGWHDEMSDYCRGVHRNLHHALCLLSSWPCSVPRFSRRTLHCSHRPIDPAGWRKTRIAG